MISKLVKDGDTDSQTPLCCQKENNPMDLVKAVIKGQEMIHPTWRRVKKQISSFFTVLSCLQTFSEKITFFF